MDLFSQALSAPIWMEGLLNRGQGGAMRATDTDLYRRRQEGRGA